MQPSLSGFLKEGQADLVGLLTEALLADVFSNRYTLHPRRLTEIAAEVAGEYFAFLDAPDDGRAMRHGRSLADDGMGDMPLLSIPPLLYAFARRMTAAAGQEMVGRVMEATGAYGRLMVAGFVLQRSEGILAEQEQLRRALSAALDVQSRELAVKDHAISTAIAGIILAGLDGRVTYVNPSFLSLWGYPSVEEVLGLSLEDFWVGEEARRILRSLPVSGGWRGELSARRKDGSLLTVALAASVVRDEQGAPIGVMASSVDMTETRRLMSQMQQVQKMDALGQLASGIAHDFNNLLTVISGHLQLLILEVSPDTQMHNDIQQIRAAVERGTALTRQLRFFTRQATGKRQLLNLNGVTQETFDLFKRTFPPEITLSLFPAADLWTVEADPNQVSQVLVNLCVNARDAILERGSGGRPPGGSISIRTANVTLTESDARSYVELSSGKYVRLTVSDTGVGIPQEILDRLFIPFVTTKEPKSGTGLGLAVVYGIVRSHGGAIDVESRVGQGSTFSVYLPVAERAAEKSAEAARPVLSPGAGTILVVDDEAQVREVMVRTLARCGYRVVEADNGRSALQILDHSGDEIRLVVLDVVMPEMEGRETYRRIQQARPGLPVLFVTGHTMDPSSADLASGGGAALMEKPLDLKLFTEKVQAMLGSSCREKDA
jgi:two-component system, cell cycle sensor histidine kinase and response regulator CckA